MSLAAGTGTPLTQQGEGVCLLIRLTPKGGRDSLDGLVILADQRIALAARVRAAPEGGKANAALLALIAKRLDLPKSVLRLPAGATSRLKSVRIAGATLAGIQEKISALPTVHKD